MSVRAIMIAVAILYVATPASAQVDFTGQWAPLYHEDTIERIPGPELGDYTGLPLSEAGRMRADSWDADRISVVQEYQCRPHSSDYSLRGLAPLRIWADYDPATQRIVAFHTHIGAYENKRTIYLDGRPHPSEYAPHTFQGFSTGVWEGNMLTVTTTHLKENYLRRNGVPRSSKATFTEHWVLHGNYLTITHVVYDPVILVEPLVRSQSWFLDPGQRAGLFPCEYLPEVPRKPERFRTICRAQILGSRNSPSGTRFPSKRHAAAPRRYIPTIARRWAPTSRRTSASASAIAPVSATASRPQAADEEDRPTPLGLRRAGGAAGTLDRVFGMGLRVRAGSHSDE